MISLPGYDAWKTTPPDNPDPVPATECCFPTMCYNCVVRGGDYRPSWFQDVDREDIQELEELGFEDAIELCVGCSECSCDDYEEIGTDEYSVSHYHYHLTSYRCLRCGREWTESDEPDWDSLPGGADWID